MVDDADAVVIPGDGAFHDAMASLENLGLVPALRRALDGHAALPRHLPGLPAALLGERGVRRGAGPRRDPRRGAPLSRRPKVPHMGWNHVQPRRPRSASSTGIPDGAHFYFVHSYYPEPAGFAVDAWRSPWCEYGVASRRPWSAGLSRAPSSIPRRASSGASGCSRTSPPRPRRRRPRAGERACARRWARRPSRSSRRRPASGRCVRLRQGRADAGDGVRRRSVAMAERWAAPARGACTSSTSTAPSPARRARPRWCEKMIAAVAARCPSRWAAACATRRPSRPSWPRARAGPWSGPRGRSTPAFLAESGRRWPDAAHRGRRRPRRSGRGQGMDGGERRAVRGRGAASPRRGRRRPALHRRRPGRHRARPPTSDATAALAARRRSARCSPSGGVSQPRQI